MAEQRQLNVIVSAVDRLSKPAASMTKDMKTLQAAGSAAADKLSERFALAGAAIVAAFASSVRAASEFQTTMNEVSTLVDTSVVDMQALAEGVNEVAMATGQSAQTLTKGLYQAISAGVDAGEAIEFLGVASRAAVAGVTNVEVAVDGMTSAINAWGMSASDAQSVADSMFMAVKGGKTTFEELSQSLFNIAPAAAASKVKLEEVNAALATMTASGVPTSVAATQLRAALVGLQRPSAELDAIFGKLGYANAQAAIEAKGMGFALDAVRDASGGSAGRLQELLGSVEAVAAANVIAGTGAAKFAQEMEAQQNAAGATDEAFGKMEIRGAQLRETLAVLQREMGNALLPTLNALAGAAKPVAQAFAWIAGTPVGAFFGGLTALVGAAAIGFYGLNKAVGFYHESMGLVNTVLEWYRARQVAGAAATDVAAGAQARQAAVMNTKVVPAFKAVAAAALVAYAAIKTYQAAQEMTEKGEDVREKADRLKAYAAATGKTAELERARANVTAEDRVRGAAILGGATGEDVAAMRWMQHESARLRASGTEAEKSAWTRTMVQPDIDAEAKQMANQMKRGEQVADRAKELAGEAPAAQTTTAGAAEAAQAAAAAAIPSTSSAVAAMPEAAMDLWRSMEGHLSRLADGLVGAPSREGERVPNGMGGIGAVGTRRQVPGAGGPITVQLVMDSRVIAQQVIALERGRAYGYP